MTARSLFDEFSFDFSIHVYLQASPLSDYVKQNPEKDMILVCTLSCSCPERGHKREYTLNPGKP